MERTADLHHTALGAPNLRTVLVAVGATDILSGATATEIAGNLTDVVSTDSAKGLKRHKRPDGDWVHIIVTTIPPLGLDVGDPREAERRKLNQLLLNNYADLQADYVVDYDTAVRDAADPSKLAAQYLTDGLPNAAYHNQIAQYLANAINDFPPRAEL
ncbi:hypothetical protein [Saccharothrix obliqua]|uniref:hypothetical protein n=1 Tax=Saccharothrix obliqua TaxID=2861747 RepID=UPI001C5F5AE8|nr:hypothetical protein [Saccharothrix obliqua]MBW4717968.1 hypothetical protein [Saccharothrix obliqua]